MPPQNRNRRICHVCKIRKKACDKALPRCGTCVQRGLPCSYRVPDRCPNEGQRPSENETLSSGLLGPLIDPSDANIDNTLYFHLGSLLRLTNLSVVRVGEQFFRDLHRGLPILCPTLFRENVARYRGRAPPADFSMLLLVLCLLAWNPSSITSSRQKPILRQSLYATISMLFKRAQTAISASTSLVQASLLIAAYEYSTGKPRIANSSLRMCARIMAAVGLSGPNNKGLKSLCNDRHIRLKAREELNLWWGVVTFERLVLCDISDVNQSPLLRYPCRNTSLPPDLPPAQDHSDLISLSGCPVMAAIHDHNISGFGRQIQVTYLLNRVLHLILHSVQNETNYIAQLKRLDQELQALMAILIRDCDHEWRYHCGAIGTAVRSLFLLHNHILALPCTSLEIEWLQKSSQAALSFVTNIMADVAHDHLQRVTPMNAGALPLSCAYNLHTSIKHLEVRRSGGVNVSKSALKSLVALDSICFRRWRSDTGELDKRRS